MAKPAPNHWPPLAGRVLGTYALRHLPVRQAQVQTTLHRSAYLGSGAAGRLQLLHLLVQLAALPPSLLKLLRQRVLAALSCFQRSSVVPAPGMDVIVSCTYR